MTDRVVELFAGHGCVLDPEAAAHIARQPDPDAYVRRLLPAFLEFPFVLTLPQLRGAEAALGPIAPVAATPGPSAPTPVPVLVTGPAPTGTLADAREHPAEVEVVFDASREAPPRGDLQDFVRYFNDRYDTLGKLVRRRREVSNAVPIARVKQAGKDVQIIGLVSDIGKGSKAGHRFLEVEDTTASTTVLVPANRPDLVALADSLLTDEVIGIAAKASKDGNLLVADAIVRPELPFREETRPPLDVPLSAAFLGDIHVGSKTFLHDAFARVVHWLHGDTGTARERALARSIKYLVLPGDVVDGVGVYPGQEDALEIPHILEQYRQLARELEGLPRHLHLIVIPGNHDASRPTEPQPAFDAEIRSFFDSLDATFISNPSVFALHSRRVLAYHGFSMIDFATGVPGLSLERPTDIMRQMLQCRHLAPAYGRKTPVAPGGKDRLVIGLEPDVFATGHVHVVGADRYKGIALVNGGTWQAQTPYQRMHNLVPTPAVLPVLNLSTFAPSMVDFSAAP